MRYKYYLLVGILLLASSTCFAQNRDKGRKKQQSIVYSVNDRMLAEKIGTLPLPGVGPRYEGGIEELRKYFADNPLKGPEAENLVFRVHIYFMVDKSGQAKNFDLVYRNEPRTPEKRVLGTLAEETLGIVSGMPQKWVPAKLGGEPVDCYQIISLTVIGGRLDKTISYR